MPEGFVLAITESSQPGDARRAAMVLASRLGFREDEAGKVAIVVTELATNLVKHGTGGELLVRPVCAGEAHGIEILALDKGPGIASIGACLRDGYSTAGSPGTGLGAARRLSATFDIHSTPGGGTGVLAQMWSRALPRGRAHESGIEIGAVCLPRRGEEMCGDGWAVEQRAGRTAIVLVDGLGHGPQAAEAALEAVQAFRANADLAPQGIVEAVHGVLRGTRGAALAVAEIDPARGAARFCGVGNIAGSIVSAEGTRHLVSHNGTAGHAVRHLGEFTYPWPPSALLVLHSDGLATHWDLQRYPGLSARHPGLIAGILYRDFKRGYDDVTVVVARESRSTPDPWNPPSSPSA